MDLQAKHLKALNKLVGEIASTNGFYSKKLQACGGADGFESLEAYSRLMPYTTKSELAADHVENPPYGTNLTYPIDQYTRLHQTSGTTGSPMAWLDSPKDWQWVLDNWKTVWTECGAKPGDTAIFPFSFGPFLGFWAAFEAGVQAGICCLPGGGQTSLQRLKMIFRYKPEWICCTPTYALHLSGVASREGLGLSTSSVRGIIVGGEPGGSIPEVRERIEAGWGGARVFDHHGMTEVGPVTYSDMDDPDLLRIVHDTYLAEVVDRETERPVPYGEVGELILTTLGRAGCPLLRYRTGDLVRSVAVLGEDPTAFALQGGILGRADDMVVVRGVNLYPSAIDAVVRSFDGVGEYQVTIDQTQPMVQVSIAAENESGGSDDVLIEKFEKQLREAFSLRIPVSVSASGSLPRFEMKARRWNVIG